MHERLLGRTRVYFRAAFERLAKGEYWRHARPRPRALNENSVSGSSPDHLQPVEPVLHPASVGRYLVFDEIGVGGMASVHLGLLSGAVGFRRIVAIKQLHSRLVHDPDFCAQFVNEARLAALIQHANVVRTLDVVWTGTELLLVLEYVDGDTLNRVLQSAAQRHIQVPLNVACSILVGVLHGLHAAHEARDEDGAPLNIVHRDVSPHNILVARGGISQVLDFGVAKAMAQGQHTASGLIKGKFGYMAPEQLMVGHVDRRTDVFAAGVVLWETLTGHRLFQSGKDIKRALARVMAETAPRPSAYRLGIPGELDAIVMKAISPAAEARFQSAEAFAVAIERAVGVASPHLVKTWFTPIASPELAQRARLIQLINKRYATPSRTPAPQSGERDPQTSPNLPVRVSSASQTRKVLMSERDETPLGPGLAVSEPPAAGDASVRAGRDSGAWPADLFELPPASARQSPGANTWLPAPAASLGIQPAPARRPALALRYRVLLVVALGSAVVAIAVGIRERTERLSTDAAQAARVLPAPRMSPPASNAPAPSAPTSSPSAPTLAPADPTPVPTEPTLVAPAEPTALPAGAAAVAGAGSAEHSSSPSSAAPVPETADTRVESLTPALLRTSGGSRRPRSAARSLPGVHGEGKTSRKPARPSAMKPDLGLRLQR
jgi:serine/threonine protein kinase